MTAPKARHAWHRLSPWPKKRPLTVRIYYRGGPEAFYSVKARGFEAFVPGWVALHDLMTDVYNSG